MNLFERLLVSLLDFSLCVVHSFVHSNRGKIGRVATSVAELNYLFGHTFSRLVGSTVAAVTQYVPGFGSTLGPLVAADKSMRSLILLASRIVHTYRDSSSHHGGDLDDKFTALQTALKAAQGGLRPKKKGRSRLVMPRN